MHRRGVSRFAGSRTEEDEMAKPRERARSSAQDIEEHLRGASDAILLLLTEIGQLERHKRGIPPDDDRFDEISRSVRVAAQALANFTKQEEDWATVATADRTDLETVVESVSSESLTAILEQWRAVERQLNETEPGSPDAIRLFAHFERLRDEYMAVFQTRHAALAQDDE
jgi:hypothetical protein